VLHKRQSFLSSAVRLKWLWWSSFSYATTSWYGWAADILWTHLHPRKTTSRSWTKLQTRALLTCIVEQAWLSSGRHFLTTNICEGWHNSLQSLFLCSNPSMWTFFNGIKKETASFLQAAAGSQRAPKKKYTDLKERVKRAMKNYGRCDRLTF